MLTPEQVEADDAMARRYGWETGAQIMSDRLVELYELSQLRPMPIPADRALVICRP